MLKSITFQKHCSHFIRQKSKSESDKSAPTSSQPQYNKSVDSPTPSPAGSMTRYKIKCSSCISYIVYIVYTVKIVCIVSNDNLCLLMQSCNPCKLYHPSWALALVNHLTGYYSIIPLLALSHPIPPRIPLFYLQN